MIENLGLHGLSNQTQKLYVAAVRKLAEYYHKSPDQITEEELRQYFLHLSNVRRVFASTLTVALCGIKFFYEQTLHQPRKVLDLVRTPSEQKLPIVLSVEEVRQILSYVNFLRYRACLGTIYACGLRIQERVQLQVKDIDAKRGVIHIGNGKVSKDRYVPLPHPHLKIITPLLGNPSSSSLALSFALGCKREPAQAIKPLTVRSLQRAFQGFKLAKYHLVQMGPKSKTDQDKKF